MTLVRAAALLTVALAAGCSAASLERRSDHLASRTATALPEPDPTARFTPEESRAPNPLDSVSVDVAVGGQDSPKLVEAFTPQLDRVAKLELRDAFGECLWKPMIDGYGEPLGGDFTLLFRTRQ
jgi:hypothetical protein